MSKAKKKTAGDTLVAGSNILICGKHFDAGSPVKGVAEDELAKAVRARRVITLAEFEARSVPEADEGQADEPADADSGDSQS